MPAGSPAISMPVNKFFIDIVFEDGSRMGMWGGTEYDEAIKIAGEIAKEEGCEIHDLFA